MRIRKLWAVLGLSVCALFGGTGGASAHTASGSWCVNTVVNYHYNGLHWQAVRYSVVVRPGANNDSWYYHQYYWSNGRWVFSYNGGYLC